MNRLIALGVGLAWAGTAAAQYPVTPYTTGWNTRAGQPAGAVSTQPPVTRTGYLDVTQPLPGTVAAVLPTTAPPGTCAGGNCVGGGGGGCGRDGRPCLQRIRDWVCYQPGPRVLPVLTPTPYKAPLRRYFPCRSDCAAPPGSCNVVGGPNAGAYGTDGVDAAGRRFGGLGLLNRGDCADGSRFGLGLLHRNDCGYGPRLRDWRPFARPSADCAVPCPIGYGYSPQLTTLPCGTYGSPYPAACEPAREPFFHRILGRLFPRRYGCDAYPCGAAAGPGCRGNAYGSPTVGGPTVVQQPTAAPMGVPGYHFAVPTGACTGNGYLQQAPANRPFTNP